MGKGGKARQASQGAQAKARAEAEKLAQEQAIEREQLVKAFETALSAHRAAVAQHEQLAIRFAAGEAGVRVRMLSTAKALLVRARAAYDASVAIATFDRGQAVDPEPPRDELEQYRDRLRAMQQQAHARIAAIRQEGDAGAADRLAQAEADLATIRADLAMADSAIELARKTMADANKILVKEKGVQVERHGRDSPTPERLAKGDMLVGDHVVREPGQTRAANEVYRGARAQSALDRYHARHEIEDVQFLAGDQFRGDWYTAGMAGAVTSRYAEPSDPGAGDAADGILDARRRVTQALRAVGLSLSPILTHVVLDGRPASEWPALAGKGKQRAGYEGLAALRLALDALAVHYRMKRPDAGLAGEAVRPADAGDVLAVAKGAGLEPGDRCSGAGKVDSTPDTPPVGG